MEGKKLVIPAEPYEFVADRLAIDLLFGSDRERRGLEAGVPAAQLAGAWEAEEEAFRLRRREFEDHPAHFAF